MNQYILFCKKQKEDIVLHNVHQQLIISFVTFAFLHLSSLKYPTDNQMTYTEVNKKSVLELAKTKIPVDSQKSYE